MTTNIDTSAITSTIANNATGVSAASAGATAGYAKVVEFVNENAIFIGVVISALSLVLAAVAHIINISINKRNAQINEMRFLANEANIFVSRAKMNGMPDELIDELERQLKESIVERRTNHS